MLNKKLTGMIFQGQTGQVVLILTIFFLCLALLQPCPDVTVEPSSPEIVVLPTTPEICVEAPNVEVVICDDRDGWDEFTVLIRMKERTYPWTVINMTAERYNDRLWIVTVDFQSHIRQYIFDEVNP